MALRSFVFIDADTGVATEQASGDSINLGGLTMSGAIAMGTNKITGLGSASSSGDALAYGQSGGSLAGLTLTGNLDLSTLNKVINSATPTNPGDLVNKSYVDQKIVTGGQIKEAIASEGQLSDAQGILANGTIAFTAAPAIGDTISITDGTLTRTYTFVDTVADELSVPTNVAIRATSGDTASAAYAMARLCTKSDSAVDTLNTMWTLHVDHQSSDINPLIGQVIQIAEKTTAAGNSTSRVYGTFSNPNMAKTVDYASGNPGVPYLDYTSHVITNIAGADPGAGRFGFRRQVSALVDGEMHFTLDENTLWAWDDNANHWQQFSGTGALPYATAAAGGGTAGLAAIDSDYGLTVVPNGVVRISLDTSAAGLTFTGTSPAQRKLALNVRPDEGLSVTGSGLGTVLLSTGGLVAGASGLYVRANTAAGIAIDANGVAVDLGPIPGLLFNSTDGLEVHLSSSGGLQKTAPDGISIKNNPAGGLTSDGSGEKIVLEASNPTLKVDGSNQLGVKYDTLKGLGTGGTGLAVKVDSSTIGFDLTGNLQVLNAAESQRIENTIAVDHALSVLDPVYITATGDRVGKADTTDAAFRVIGIARTAQGTVGQTAEIVTAGLCKGVLSSATPGTNYWLANGGGLSTTIPTGSGRHIVFIGTAISATDLFVRIVDQGKKA